MILKTGMPKLLTSLTHFQKAEQLYNILYGSNA